MMLTKNEIAYVVGFLNELENEFSNASCNDMFLPDTPENKRMIKEASIEEMGNDFNEDWLKAHMTNGEMKIGTNNHTILNYLKRKLIKTAGLKENEIPDTANW